MIGKLLRTGIGLSALFAIAACSGQPSPQASVEAPQVQTAEAAIHPLAGQVVGEREGHGDHDAYSPKALASLGGEFELVEATKGGTFTEKDLLGEFALVYFGYMECLEACPIALKSMPAAVDGLKAAGIPTKAVFIDINAPRLDDLTGGLAHGGHEGGQVTQASTHGHDAAPLTGPEVRRRAIAQWGPKIYPEMIFLSGTRKQVLGANKAYQSRVEAAMMKNEEPIHHINHTTTIYVQDPQGRVAGLVYHSDSVATMVAAVKEIAKKVPAAAAPAPSAPAKAPAGHSGH
jgi:cytochrome oxidase Cu insertion factor (SCO1/SenC/PrrC family)